MRKIFLFAVMAVIIGTVSQTVFSQNREGFVKEELRGAINVTDNMVAPIRFVEQEVWYDVLLEDPRYGKYKGGYTVLKIQWDKTGDLVFLNEDSLSQQLYSVEFSASESSLKTYINPDTGKTTKIEYKAKGKIRGLWIVGSYMSPESSIEIDKTAYFDWSRNQITIVYGSEPDAHRRVIPIESGSVSMVSYYAFMMKLRGKEGALYHFKVFDIFTEKFVDSYMKYEGKRDDGVHKFITVPAGWGNEVVVSFWFGPPTEEAPNGKFVKVVTNPVVSRYITLLPVTKEKALGPVTPMVD